MKIYTRTGDRGETGLFGGQRVRKDNIRVDAYGAVDELNSSLGLAVARLETDGEAEIARGLRAVQADLLTVGAILATPRPEDGGRENANIPELAPERVREMEQLIDRAETELEPLSNFILPGGGEAAARIHFARTICRRAERRAVSLAYDAHIEEDVIIYLNRLSDLLFTLARLANRHQDIEDISWVPNPRASG